MKLLVELLGVVVQVSPLLKPGVQLRNHCDSLLQVATRRPKHLLGLIERYGPLVGRRGEAPCN